MRRNLCPSLSYAQVQRKIEEFNAQGLANTAWAFATLGEEQPRLFDSVMEVPSHRIRSL